MKSKHRIMGVHITERVQHVPAVQHVLTEYGCWIKTRLGLHEADPSFCSPNGLLLLEVLDDEEKANELKTRLEQIDGVDVQSMLFDHP